MIDLTKEPKDIANELIDYHHIRYLSDAIKHSIITVKCMLQVCPKLTDVFEMSANKNKNYLKLQEVLTILQKL